MFKADKDAIFLLLGRLDGDEFQLKSKAREDVADIQY